jgi:hypothetical protein
MSAPEMTLDFIKALLWPAVIVVGVFWLFRSEVRGLFKGLSDVFDRRRVKTVKTPGGFEIELEQLEKAAEQAVEVLKDRVEESREEAAKAEDPESRERWVEKLEQESAALGSLRMIRAYTGSWRDFRPITLSESYIERIRSAAERRGLSEGDQSMLVNWVRTEFQRDQRARVPFSETADRLGGLARCRSG